MYVPDLSVSAMISEAGFQTTSSILKYWYQLIGNQNSIDIIDELERKEGVGRADTIGGWKMVKSTPP